MSHKPLISIVLLSYNRLHLLKMSLPSILSQTYENIEILVVDNPSATSEAIRKYVLQFPQVQLLMPTQNLGFAGGMNYGLANSKGEYVLLTEDDILVPSSVVEIMMGSYTNGIISAVMKNHSDGTIRFAGGRITLTDQFKMEIYKEESNSFKSNYLPGAFIFASKDLLNTLGGFFEPFFMYMEDVDLSLRVEKLGLDISVCREICIYHFDPPIEPVPYWLEKIKIRNLLWLMFFHASLRCFSQFFYRQYVIGLIVDLFKRPKLFYAKGASILHSILRMRMLRAHRVKLRNIVIS